MKKRYLFLTLNTFSATGGIEKICRVASKALHELVSGADASLSVYSVYDEPEGDGAYLPKQAFRGFAGSRLKFALASLLRGRKSDTVLLSHINLLPIGYLIKKLSPKTRLVLMAHGIEVWGDLSERKKRMLQSVDLFLPVSRFTAEKLQAKHNIAPQKIRVLNNCIDPFLQRDKDPVLEASLRKKYNISNDDKVLLTVTRLKGAEQYKGYDKVIEALSLAQKTIPQIKYLIVGKYDTEEKGRLDDIIRKEGVGEAVIFAGFAKDEELQAHFNLADVFIMPSTGEGFGIVFIEALFFGLPVIAGNRDGSVDALAGGKFGLLINPLDVAAITDALVEMVTNKDRYIPDQDQVKRYFGFDTYRNNIGASLGLLKQRTGTLKAIVS